MGNSAKYTNVIRATWEAQTKVKNVRMLINKYQPNSATEYKFKPLALPSFIMKHINYNITQTGS